MSPLARNRWIRAAALIGATASLTLPPVALAQTVAGHVKVFDGRTEPKPAPVLLVLANRDFSYPEYSALRSSLEAAGIPVRVGAARLEPCVPQGGDPSQVVQPDVELAIAPFGDFSGGVFVGGWGASSYQWAFDGTYLEPDYRRDPEAAAAVNRLVEGWLAAGRPVGAVGHGVSVLAWARVDGTSPLQGRPAAASVEEGPRFWKGRRLVASATARWHAEANGALLAPPGSVGDPSTPADDVVVDGRIITAEDWPSAPALGSALAAAVREQGPVVEGPRRVLMVIANRDFWYREYAEPRAVLEAAGIQVEVAAAEAVPSTPQAGSGFGGDGIVVPDRSVSEALELFRADPGRYDAVTFVGGWGASSYQYAFPGTYDEPSYNGAFRVRQDVSDLVELFLARDKRVAALCHGVTVLAWARVDGVSPLQGRTVVTWPGLAPAEVGPDGQPFQRLTREHVEANGAVVLPAGSVGDPGTSADDVVVDGRIITGQDYDSSRAFGLVLARELLAE
ncbi:MAG: hypothetical protein EDX89_18180 [Acidobacteria bacterium]|nr:MAG: hypothetical protein EDX89_18180 [Acidobacteriota bacterium]MCE7959599.1 hypothetical protein [Acidobacteria bacterium ACB2]